MFGPKNATANQVQYLHIPEWVGKETDFVSVENLNKAYPVSNAMVMTATQFDGIPMADVFKVYMYWSFEAVCNTDERGSTGDAPEADTVASLCHVRMGLRVDFLKSTMLKSQIFDGTKEELVLLSKQWEQFNTGELATHSKRQALILLSKKSTDGFYSDSDLSGDSDEESVIEISPSNVSMKEQIKAALIEHDKMTRAAGTVGGAGLSSWHFWLVIIIVVIQMIMLLIMQRRLSYLSDVVEGFADRHCQFEH